MQNEKEDMEEGPVVKDLQMNWEHFRMLSLMAGGFGEDRTRAWYVALRVTYPWITYPLRCLKVLPTTHAESRRKGGQERLTLTFSNSAEKETQLDDSRTTYDGGQRESQIKATKSRTTSR